MCCEHKHPSATVNICTRRQRICMSLGTPSKRLMTSSAPGAQLAAHIPGRTTTRRVPLDVNVPRARKSRAAGRGPMTYYHTDSRDSDALRAGRRRAALKVDRPKRTEPLDEHLDAGAPTRDGRGAGGSGDVLATAVSGVSRRAASGCV